MKKQKLLIASNNPAKLEQMSDYLKDIPFEIVSLSDCGITHDVEETGTTFEENATLKAKTYGELSGLLTLADDSGLEIDALDGQPGIYSARFAGPNKTDKEKIEFVLDKMKDIPPHERTAQFTSVVALYLPEDGSVKTFRGQSHGRITKQPLGSEKDGFPYYQIYELEGTGKTIAQLEDSKTPFIFHRHKSLGQAKEYLLSIEDI